PASVFVPETAPQAKVSRLHAYGADVHQVGTTYTEALEASAQAGAAPGALAIHAYDAPHTVAGQGTIAIEVEEQASPDTVLVAVGGGGLIGGVSAWYAGRGKVVGVEPEHCNTLAAALA